MITLIRNQFQILKRSNIVKHKFSKRVKLIRLYNRDGSLKINLLSSFYNGNVSISTSPYHYAFFTQMYEIKRNGNFLVTSTINLTIRSRVELPLIS